MSHKKTKFHTFVHMDYYQLYETIDGPSGLLDFVLRALQALRSCDPRNGALDSEKSEKKSPKNTKI